MTGSTFGLGDRGTPSCVPLATVEIDRQSERCWHPRFGHVEQVDHITAWVFEDGSILAAVLRRSAYSFGQAVERRRLDPVFPAVLTAVERQDVLHAAGLGRGDRALREEPTNPRIQMGPLIHSDF